MKDLGFEENGDLNCEIWVNDINPVLERFEI